MKALLLVCALLVAVCGCTSEEPAQATDQVAQAQLTAFDTPPEPIARVEPEYPAEARMNGAEGRTLVEVFIDESGTVQSARTIESSGHESLDVAAQTAARQWRFRAAQLAAKDVAAKIVIPFEFKLH